MTKKKKTVMAKVCFYIFVLGVFSSFSTAVYAFLDDTPDSDKEKAPAPHDVQPVIELDKADPTYDLWKLIRDDLSEGREPGPINIQRTWGGFGWQGIPTFFRLPVALVPADLEAARWTWPSWARTRTWAWDREEPHGVRRPFERRATNM